ncbi:MAG: hypothetical protein JWP69_2218 [Flaviaesturariibacter sp.]|nr:hypothetical protein [Flaviaesturariibacter sp.]
MKWSPLFFLVFVVGFFSLLGYSCANIVPPLGGPRDSLPPRLVKATPPDSATNFTGRRIELEFDEFLDDLQDISRNLLFTPLFNTNPSIAVKLRTMTINLRDSLEPNTTYTFNFGDAIRDINEGNVLRNFSYTFSTGSALDSLTFSGRVMMAETGKVDTTLIVVLYRNLSDSAVRLENPRYVTKLDGAGNFSFRNLPAGRFAVYALSPSPSGRRYLNPVQQAFGFLDSSITVRSGVAPVSIMAYKDPAPITAATASTGGRVQGAADKRLRITNNLSNNQQDLLSDLVLNFERPLRGFDSAQVRLSIDSTFKPVPFSIALDSFRQKATIRTAWQEGKKYNLELGRDFAEDTTGRKLLKSDTLHFTTKKRSDYATVSIKLRNLDATQKPVLQFFQNGALAFSVAVPNGSFSSSLFVPGDYELRVLYDRNGNGKWDPGQFFGTKRQPEIVKPVERRALIKAGVENEFEASL